MTGKEKEQKSDVVLQGGPIQMRPGKGHGWTAAEELLTLTVTNPNPGPPDGRFRIEIGNNDPENNVVPPGGSVGYRIDYQRVTVDNTGDVVLTATWSYYSYQYGEGAGR